MVLPSSSSLLTQNFRDRAWDCIVIGGIYKAAMFLDTFINPESLSLPHPILYPVAHLSLWSLYGFCAGLFGTGLWVIAHECGHQAFSESKFINNSVGWVLHSAYAIFFVLTHFHD
jgi:omega-6 fatty acid desaturase (delta-12 desaturase)